jgi:hypothetical protein
MVKRFLYVITAVIILMTVSLISAGQAPSIYKVKSIPLNSGAFNEMAPVVYNDGILFCSDMRFSGIKDRTSFDGKRLYNIYVAEREDTVRWKKPIMLKSERSTLFTNGPLSISADKKTVWFTSETETGRAARKRNFKNHNGIFSADLSGTNLSAVRPFKYNSTQYEVAHPSISSDGRYLFFASDMPGGQGGADIYYCEFINGDWSAPVNLGSKVNSAADEYFPYMHPSGRLYFTSRRAGGAGGMDVYYTMLTYGSWDDPVLLPEPINSSSDDFAFVAQDDLQKGYFTTTRDRSSDIYEFKSTIRRIAKCDSLEQNSFCYRFFEENAQKWDTLPFRYEWKFGDGKKANGAVVEHCYTGPGTFLVQLDVVNLITKEVLYNEKSDTLVLTEIEQPYITAPDKITAGQRITLDAGKTNLPGWNITQYYWNLGDETVLLGNKIDKVYSKPGVYNIQLIVKDQSAPGGEAREECVSKNIIVLRQP